MNTIIGIPAQGSYWPSDDDRDDDFDREEETVPDPIDIYERPYNILFDGVSDALRLLRAKEYDKAIQKLMQAQIDADVAVCE